MVKSTIITKVNANNLPQSQNSKNTNNLPQNVNTLTQNVKNTNNLPQNSKNTNNLPQNSKNVKTTNRDYLLNTVLNDDDDDDDDENNSDCEDSDDSNDDSTNDENSMGMEDNSSDNTTNKVLNANVKNANSNVKNTNVKNINVKNTKIEQIKPINNTKVDTIKLTSTNIAKSTTVSNKNATSKNIAIKSDTSINTTNTDVAATKRRVGRPCKTKINKLVALDGIVEFPKDSNNAMELMCHDPGIFKKIIGLLKSYQVDDVEFVFNKDSITLATEDHNKHTKIFKKINGNKLTWYYLDKNRKNNKGDQEVRICIARTEIEEIFNSIDKTYDLIKIWISSNDINSEININLHHIPYDADQHFIVPVKQFTSVIEKPIINDKFDYPIRFTLSTKAFKHYIERMDKLFSKITIKKESKQDPLILEASINQGKKMSTIFNNNEKIFLKDFTNDGDIVSIEMMSEHIVLLSKTTMGDSINIWIDNHKAILFQMSLSDICDIEVYTNTNDSI